MNVFLKGSLLRGAFAGAALFFNSASLTNETITLSIKTYDGFQREASDGTWVNDLTNCLRNTPITHKYSREDGLIRKLVGNVCGVS